MYISSSIHPSYATWRMPHIINHANRSTFWKTMISMPISTIKTYRVDVQWFLDISCTLFWPHLTTRNVWKLYSSTKTCVHLGPPTGIRMHIEHVANQRAPRCKEELLENNDLNANLNNQNISSRCPMISWYFLHSFLATSYHLKCVKILFSRKNVCSFRTPNRHPNAHRTCCPPKGAKMQGEFWKTMISMPISTIKTYQVNSWYFLHSFLVTSYHLKCVKTLFFHKNVCSSRTPNRHRNAHRTCCEPKGAKMQGGTSGKQWSQCQSQQSNHIE